jgi:hypothetical protein
MFTLGCDPELTCYRIGRFVPANNYFNFAFTKNNFSFLFIHYIATNLIIGSL